MSEQSALRLRRSHAFGFVAALDLDTAEVTFYHEPIGEPRAFWGSGRYVPLGGKLLAEFESGLGRGNRTWSYSHGPWADAERVALATGVGPPRARADAQGDVAVAFAGRST